MSEVGDFLRKMKTVKEDPLLTLPGGGSIKHSKIIEFMRSRNNKLARDKAKKSGSSYEVELEVPALLSSIDPFSGNLVVEPSFKVSKITRSPYLDYRRKFNEGDECGILLIDKAKKNT